jgi:DNA-binding transcriptional ArsR family regulator
MVGRGGVRDIHSYYTAQGIVYDVRKLLPQFGRRMTETTQFHDGPSDEQFLRIFEALSDPMRLDIIRQISHVDELACTTLDETLPVSKSTISYHVKILSHAHLISVRKEGRNYFYRLRHETFEHLLPTFLTHIRDAPAERSRQDVTV